MRRCLLLVVAALLCGACSLMPSQPSAPVPAPGPGDVDSAPTGAVDREALEQLPDRVPVEEPRSATGNKSYEVFGERYTVLSESRNYTAEGVASWYGKKFHGRRTSSGEKFDMFALSAAHRSLPLPCFARVTNLANGRSTVVRINDRGPFHRSRVIDLSYAAAVKLGFDRAGTARVRVETLEPTSASLATPTPPHEAMRYVVQAGAFRSAATAEALVKRLARVVEDGTLVHNDKGEDGIYRVRVGPFPDHAEASRVRAALVRLAGDALILRQ